MHILNQIHVCYQLSLQLRSKLRQTLYQLQTVANMDFKFVGYRDIMRKFKATGQRHSQLIKLTPCPESILIVFTIMALFSSPLQSGLSDVTSSTMYAGQSCNSEC
uniref:Uncharacterized protein n=1 Tax=Glossina austeni TaxID=7395 RepID=A0A1A9V542_GLOAU